jgi:tRNA G10  N-methylase Trm11
MQPMSDLIKSIGYDQGEILRNILKLHVPEGKIDCDPTFSTGAFYNGTGIAIPLYRFDISPQRSDVVQADARNLPLADSSISCMMLDPPFLATKGKSLRSGKGNIINRRFGVYPDEKSLHRCYEEMLAEAYRVLKPDGILIFKCQDKVSSGKQYMSHVYIINEAVRIGFYPKDLFILLAKSRLVAGWQRNQKHSRKYHSYFLVFQKNNRRIEYV